VIFLFPSELIVLGDFHW